METGRWIRIAVNAAENGDGYLMAGIWLAELTPLCDTCVACGNIETFRAGESEKLK